MTKTSEPQKTTYVLFIVEGKSDQHALESPIKKLYEKFAPNKVVEFIMITENGDKTGGDITTKGTSTKNTIEESIRKYILKPCLCGYMPKAILPSIEEIVHIVDLDGAFIPDEKIKEDKSISHIRYEVENIVCKKRTETAERNKRKRENLEHLISLEEFIYSGHPMKYYVYYFSSNLDHFLHNDANLDYRQKTIAADLFADTYNDSQKFVSFFLDKQNPTHNMSYKESWEYVKQGTNSLAKGTNLNVLIKKLWAEGNS